MTIVSKRDTTSLWVLLLNKIHMSPLLHQSFMGFHGLDMTARLRREIMTKKVVIKIVTYASRYLTECPLSRGTCFWTS